VTDNQRSERWPKRPRVLVMGQGYPTLGGIPTFIDRLINDAWLRERVDFEFLNTTPRGVKRPAAFRLSNLWLVVRDAFALFARARDKDVVHLNLAPAPLLPLLRALILCSTAKLARARVILHAHSGRLERSINQRTFRVAMALVLRLVDSFVVVSRSARAAVGRVSTKATYIPNGIDVRGVPTGPKDDFSTLVFVGTVCERKGLLDLREALVALQRNGGARNAEFRVFIVGDAKQEGPGVYERIQEMYAQANLTNVDFTGPVQRNELLELLARAQIFCLPSHWEGFPLSLLEAMSAEAAVVATRVGEIPAILDNGNIGILVEPHDPDGLAAAIERLLHDPGLRKRLARAGRSRVEREYGHDKTTLELYNQYRRLSAYSK
jgi:glycosyltransferase involved in cell wall biosynthesis